MIKLRSLPLFVLASAFLVPAFAPGQGVAATARIVNRIDESQLVTLKGNTHPFANAKNDRGAVSPDFSMPDLTLVLSRSAEQESAFEAFIESQYDSASPSYHQWLTPQQIGAQYGPAQADIATITNWLTGHGFTVKSVAPDRMSIKFSGTAGQVQSAFHTEIHNLSVNGASHYANMSDPQIPAALAPVVIGVKALHNFLPHPMHTKFSQAQFNKQAGKWARVPNTAATATLPNGKTSFATPQAAAHAAAQAAAGTHPLFGINVPADPSEEESAYLEEDVTPWDFATIYNVIPAWNAGYTGSGQTIAIAGTSLISQSSVGSPSPISSGTVRSESGTDVSTFRSTFGLPALSSFEQIDTDDGPTATECTSTNPDAACGIGDLEENSLDVEWSGSVATGASIVLVVTGQNSAGSIDTVYDSAQYVVQNDLAKILNVSYGECELFQGTAGNVLFYDLWKSAAAEGIAVFVASGDSGSPSCDDGGDSIGNPYPAQYGLSVSGLASTPYNVAVGGTDFSWCRPTINSSGNLAGCPTSSSEQSSPAYWSTSNNSTTEPYESALGYVPEIPWNETCENPIWSNYLASLASYNNDLYDEYGPDEVYGTVPVPTNAEASCNLSENYDDNYTIYEDLGVTLAYWVDTIGGSGGASNCVVNDEDSDANNPTCTTGSTSTGTANGSIPLTNNGWQKPSWQTGVTGIPSDGVRDLPDVSFFAGDGDLDSAYLVCVSAIGSCSYGGTSSTTENTAEEAGGTSFASPAMAGVMALINQKAGVPQGLPAKELYQIAATQNYGNCSAEGPPQSTCYFYSIDEGTNSMPCEAVANLVIGDVTGYGYYGVESPNCTALNGGDEVGTLTSASVVTSANPSGVAYNAETGYNMATGLGSLNVYNVVNAWASEVGTAKATMTITTTPAASSGTITIASGVSLVLDATVTGSSGTPTGDIAVSGGGYSTSSTLNSSGEVSISVPAGSFAPGTDTVTVTYSGDGTYASTSQTLTLSVALSAPTVTVTAPTTDNIANPVPVSVTVTGVGSSIPTGTVTLAGGSFSSGATTLSSSGTASWTIPAGDLPAGSDTLTASYSGSSSYTGGSGTWTIGIVSTTPLTPTVTVTVTNPATTPPAVDSSQSVTVKVKVTPPSGDTTAPTPTGLVTLTSGNYSSGAIAITGSVSITILGCSSSNTNCLSANTSGETDTLTAGYSGDANYATGTGTSTITVTQSAYSLSATTPSSVSPGGTTTSTISGSSTTDYTGTVTLSSCSLTNSSVANPNAPPSCSASGTITFSSGAASGTATATVYTTAQTTSSMSRPRLPGGKGWLGAGSGAALALLVFFGIPARRRSWLQMLSVLVALVAIGAMTSCGGSSSGCVTNCTVQGTSAGTYTFTVQGAGNDPDSTQESTTFTVTVN